jgi:dTMP kinase
MGARIRSLVLSNGEEADSPSPRAEALLYAADRAHHVATVVRPALARGAMVISDRYVDSSLAYQGAGRTLPVQEISWLSSWATGGLKPDLVVLLDVDPSVGLGRVDSRGLGTDRLEGESRSFHERVRYAFLDLASADPKRYLVLDAARPADEIAAVIATRINTMLSAGDDTHPEPASMAVPPGPDLNAPDLTDTRVMPPHATMTLPPFEDPHATRVVRSGDDPSATMTLPPSDDPNATMTLPPSDDPNATVVVRPAAADSASVAWPDDSVAAAGTGAEPADRPAPDDDGDEKPIEVLEELTGNRARAADEEPPPDDRQVGGWS